MRAKYNWLSKPFISDDTCTSCYSLPYHGLVAKTAFRQHFILFTWHLWWFLCFMWTFTRCKSHFWKSSGSLVPIFLLIVPGGKSICHPVNLENHVSLCCDVTWWNFGWYPGTVSPHCLKFSTTWTHINQKAIFHILLFFGSATCTAALYYMVPAPPFFNADLDRPFGLEVINIRTVILACQTCKSCATAGESQHLYVS